MFQLQTLCKEFKEMSIENKQFWMEEEEEENIKRNNITNHSSTTMKDTIYQSIPPLTRSNYNYYLWNLEHRKHVSVKRDQRKNNIKAKKICEEEELK